ncbi:MAG: site-2 protease family protein [Clostridiaceae bacterium]|jgi:Zn-dependent protease|nr:site-2 protease family protein [Clostridiaceae bacterium]
MLIGIILSGESVLDILLTLIAVLAAVFFAIVLHEIAHGFIALKNGDPTAKFAGRLSLNPVKHIDPIGLILMLFVGIGWAKPVPVDSRNFRSFKKGMFTVSIAGVTMNFILALFSFLMLGVMSVIPASALVNNVAYAVYELFLMFFLYSTLINIGLILFNLLPIYPLDGYRIIETFAPDSRYCRFMRRYGSRILMAVLIGSYVLGRIYPPLDLFGIYMNLSWVERLILLAWG